MWLKTKIIIIIKIISIDLIIYFVCVCFVYFLTRVHFVIGFVLLNEHVNK
jgi:hypothetical protein